MSEYTCPRCGYKTSFIGNLHKHFNKKRACVPKIADLPFDKLYQIYYANNYINDSTSHNIASTEEIKCEETKCEEIKSEESITSKKYVCKHCFKVYNHSSSMYKHIKKDHSNPNDYEERIKNLQEQVEDLQAKLNNAPTSGPSTIINNNSTTNNTTNNTNNQILIIQNFGNENIDYITNEYVANKLKQPKQGINEIIRQIHFNPGRPENHNVKITNKKLPYASVFKNNDWELDDKKKIINQMITKSYCIMDNVYHDQHDTLMPSTRRQFETFQNKFDEQDSKLKKDLERNTEIQILNEQKVHYQKS